MKRIVLLFVIAISFIGAKAQQDMTLYNMKSVFQSNYLNPSFHNYSKVNIGLPGISSIYGNVNNSGFKFNPLLVRDQHDSLELDLDNFVNQLGNRNYIGANVRVDLLSFSFRVKEKNWFSFNLTEKMDAYFIYPKGLIQLAAEGNGKNLLGNTADMSWLGLNAMHYREWSFGYAREISDQWTIGSKFKILGGIFNVNSRTPELSLHTDETTFDLTAKGQGALFTSGFNGMINDSLYNTGTKDFMFKGNNGVAVDFGATYKMNDNWEFSASLLDLGYLTWKYENLNYVATDLDYTFSGLDVKPTLNGTDSTIDVTIDNFLDSLQGTVGVTENNDRYTTALYSKMYLGANYLIGNKHRLTGVVLLEQVKNRLRSSYSVGYQIQLKRWLTATANYSIIHRDYMNLGFGFAINGGPIQLYAGIDNLLVGVMNQYGQADASGNLQNPVIVPRFSKNAHAHVGLNLTFGRREKDRDGDGIKDSKDDCPDTPGLEQFNGCPDTDLDSIPDIKDDCPDLFGLKEFNGCPDTDKDGIMDKLDSCVTVPGIPEFNGCPDTDGDGIQDKLDSCAAVAGLKEFNGCPDKDADGIQDSKDDCPEKAGLEKFNGCPDTDGDGLKDFDDSCPEEAGPIENKGCPWQDVDGDGLLDKDDKCPTAAGPKENEGCPYDDLDGDGVPDKSDRCPQTPGPVDNEGCPVIDEKEQEVLNTAFDNLEFEIGRAVIKEESFTSLNELADLLKKKDGWKLLIEGHTDSVGSSSNNKRLSQKRADAVKKFLSDRGVGTDRLTSKGYGEEKPIATNDTKEGRQKNRRVEMTVQFE